MALARTVKDERKGKTLLMNTPGYSHTSMGAVERMNRSLAGQIRSLRLSLQKQHGQRLAATHPLTPWLIRHAAWVLTRFTVWPSGHVPYESTRGRAYRSELVELGEQVYT